MCDEDKSYELNQLIYSESDKQLCRLYDIRNSLDGKILSVLGAIIGLVSFIVTKIDFKIYLYNNPSQSCLFYLSIIIATLSILTSVILLIISVRPMGYSYIIFEDILINNEKTVKKNMLLIGINKKMKACIEKCKDANKEKARLLSISIVLGIIGLIILTLSYIITKSL